jgi:hypothetical protein
MIIPNAIGSSVPVPLSFPLGKFRKEDAYWGEHSRTNVVRGTN